MHRHADNLDLFDLTPIARNSDPETSHEAADEYTETGDREKDMRRMQRMVRNNPGLTAAEYSVLLYSFGMDFYKAAHLPHKRLADLEVAGLVEKGEPRRCSKTGRRVHTWYIAGAAPMVSVTLTGFEAGGGVSSVVISPTENANELTQAVADWSDS